MTAVRAGIASLFAFGITHFDIPFTPEKIWRAINAARRGRKHAAD